MQVRTPSCVLPKLSNHTSNLGLFAVRIMFHGTFSPNKDAGIIWPQTKSWLVCEENLTSLFLLQLRCSSSPFYLVLQCLTVKKHKLQVYVHVNPTNKDDIKQFVLPLFLFYFEGLLWTITIFDSYCCTWATLTWNSEQSTNISISSKSVPIRESTLWDISKNLPIVF